MPITFIKPSSCADAEKTVIADLPKKIHLLYSGSPCCDVKKSDFKYDLSRLKRHYQQFFKQLKLKPDLMDPIFNRMISDLKWGHSELPQMKEFLETILVYGREEKDTSQIKQLLKDFSQNQLICFPGIVTNLSAIIYRLEIGDTPEAWLGDLREIIFEQAIQGFLKANPVRIEEGMEIHFFNNLKLSPIVADLSLPSTHRLRTVKDPYRYAHEFVLTAEECINIRDRFWLNYLSEDFTQQIKKIFENALQCFWEGEFGATDGRGEELHGKEKIAQANEDRDNVLRITKPFVDAEILEDGFSVLTMDGNNLSKEFKEKLESYCQQLLEKDFLYTKNQKQTLITSFYDYLLDENPRERLKDYKILTQTPLGFEFLISSMLDPHFPIDLIRAKRMKDLLYVSINEQSHSIGCRLKLALTTSVYDEFFKDLAHHLLAHVDIPTWSRTLPKGTLFEGLSILSLIYMHPVLQEKVLLTLFEKHAGEIKNHGEVFGKAISTPLWVNKNSVLTILNITKDDFNFLAPLLSPNVGVAPFLDMNVFFVSFLEETLLSRFVKNGLMAEVQDYFMRNIDKLIGYLMDRPVDVFGEDINLAKMLTCESGRKDLDILFNDLKLKDRLLYSELFFNECIKQITVDPGIKEYSALGLLCKEKEEWFFSLLEHKAFVDKVANNINFYGALFTKNRLSEGTIIVIDKLFPLRRGQNILQAIAAHDDFPFKTLANNVETDELFQLLCVIGHSGFIDWFAALNENLANIAENKEAFLAKELMSNLSFPERAFWLIKNFDLNVNQQDHRGTTALHWACINERVDVIKLLLAHDNIDVNLQDNRRRTALHEACCTTNPQPILKVLLTYPGIEINGVADRLETPLSLLCKYHEDLISLLLQQGTCHNINASFKTGFISKLFLLLEKKPELLGQTINFEGPNAKNYSKKLTQLRQKQFKKAWKKDKLDLLQALAHLPDLDMNQSDKDGVPFFVWACHYGNIELVQKLLKKDININQIGDFEKTPLIAACERFQVDIVKLLLNQIGINIEWKDRHKKDVLDYACLQYETEIIQLLMTRDDVNINRPIDGEEFLLHWLYANKYMELLYELLQRKDLDVNCKDANGQTLLQEACDKENLSLVEALLNHKNIEVNAINENTMQTAAHIVCMKNNINFVKVLLNANADVNQEDINGLRPLHFACNFGNVDIVQALLLHDKTELFAKDDRGETAFDIAFRQDYSNIVVLFLNNNNANFHVNQKGENGETLLHLACFYGYEKIVHLLLGREDTQINHRDDYGQTALNGACFNGHIAIVNELLNQKDIDVNCADDGNHTAFYCALAKNHIAIIERLLAHPDLEVVSCLVMLLEHNNMDVHNEKQHKNIVTCFIKYIPAMQHIHHLLAILEAIGVGKGNKKGDNAILSELRYRNLKTVKLFKEMGYRETNDTEKLALEIFSRAEDLLKERDYQIDSNDEYEKFEGIYNRQITRKPKKEKIEKQLAAFDKKVIKQFEGANVQLPQP